LRCEIEINVQDEIADLELSLLCFAARVSFFDQSGHVMLACTCKVLVRTDSEVIHCFVSVLIEPTTRNTRMADLLIHHAHPET